MTSNRHEHLLGYLLGALEPEEHELVERELAHDPRLREELDRLTAKLEPLAVDREHHEPPDGLALRTCVWLATQARDQAAGDASDSANDRVSLPARRMSASREVVRVSRWSIPDIVVTAGVLLAATVLFFPAIASSRIRAQLLSCQNNLRQFGLALTAYSDKHSGFFPPVALTGNRGVAGIFGPTLVDQQLVDDKNVFLCPSSELGRDAQKWRGVPSLIAIDSATPEELPNLQRTMGGSYAYGVGYISGGEYHTPRNLYRPYFPIMSDTPSPRLPGRSSLNHGGRGQNVLLEDGHIQFLPKAETDARRDAIFLNGNQLPEAGLHIDDAMLGGSDTRPMRSGIQVIVPGDPR